MKAALPAEPVDTLAPEVSARLIAFGRACKAAARAVALYPSEHPAVNTALRALVQVATAAAANGPLVLGVLKDTLTIDGRRAAHPDIALSELASLLHGRAVGQFEITATVDAETWRAFLLLLARQADETREAGGLAQVWAATRHAGLELRAIDYAEVLRGRRHGDRADWPVVVEHCLAGQAARLDDESLETLADIFQDPSRLVPFAESLEASAPEDLVTAPRALARTLQAVAGLIARRHPEGLDTLFTKVASAANQLSLDAMLRLLEGAPAGDDLDVQSPTGQVVAVSGAVQEVARRLPAEDAARVVARAIVSGQGPRARLAKVFQTLVPDATRQSPVLALAREQVAEQIGPRTAAFEELWKEAERLLVRHVDRHFVSGEYSQELSRVLDPAFDIDQIPDDPPEQVTAWVAGLSERAVRALDARMVLDLLRVDAQAHRWAEVAAAAVTRAHDLLVLGEFDLAEPIVHCLSQEAAGGGDHSAGALAAMQQLWNGSLMRHLASHLDAADDARFEQVKRLCLTLGPAVIPSLADALSHEERERARLRLCDVLLAFGPAGRQSVEQLKQSQNANVRRTAIHLLREFGGDSALPELASLLDDTEPHVQRDAVQAIVTIRTRAGYAVLEHALATGSERSRAAITNALASLRGERAVPLFCYFVERGPCRGPLQLVCQKAAEALGGLGVTEAVECLSQALYRGNWWTPISSAAFRSSVATALGRIDTAEARSALARAAAEGSGGTRKAARAAMAGGRR
jgi:hypothetical protein